MTTLSLQMIKNKLAVCSEFCCCCMAGRLCTTVWPVCFNHHGPRMHKQTNKQTNKWLCFSIPHRTDLPAVADVSIDSQLNVYRRICLCTVMLLCTYTAKVSNRLGRPSLEVSCSPTKQAPINPVQWGRLISVYPRARNRSGVCNLTPQI